MNIDILQIVQLFLGVVFAFMGANIFRSMPPVGGFLVGGLIGLTAIGFIAPDLNMGPLIGFVAGGVMGALIAIPLQIVIIVLSGSILGGLAGAVAGLIISQQGVPRLVVEGIFSPQIITPFQGWMILVFALVFGVLSVRFDEGMLIGSTSFLGAFAAAAALSKLGASTSPVFTNPLFLFFFWVTLGLISAIWQNYNSSDD